MAFDGITTKAIAYELNKLSKCKIDKVYQPTKNNIVLGLYNEGTKFALNICIDSSYYRINLTTHTKTNPTVAPNFCMLLRKHLIGYRIESVSTYDLERVVILKLKSFDDLNTKKLIVELMGKHSNIILTNEDNIIIDSLRHTNTLNNSYRDIYPHKKYISPKSDKLSFLELENFEDFYKIIKPNLEKETLDMVICNKFTGMSRGYIKYLIKTLNLTNNNREDLKIIYSKLQQIIKNIASCELSFKITEDKKDYVLVHSSKKTPFELNFFIDDFYCQKESNENFVSYRNSILKLILELLKKYNKRLININEKLEECNSKEQYKLYGELLIANLYQINNKHLKEVEVINYYDNNNIISIPLDEKYTTNENSNRYFKKYNKLKNALDIVAKQKEETLLELDYIESVIYELEEATTIENVQDIFEEISENVIFKEKLNKKTAKKKNMKNKKVKRNNFNPLEYNVDGFEILVGRNNKENDWITTKCAVNSDLWFHTKDIHGSHVILKTKNKENISTDILIKCAELAAKHSKAKQASNVPVDYCKIQYVRKPNGAKPGMVIYTNNKTLYVTPEI